MPAAPTLRGDDPVREVDEYHGLEVLLQLEQPLLAVVLQVVEQRPLPQPASGGGDGVW